MRVEIRSTYLGIGCGFAGSMAAFPERRLRFPRVLEVIMLVYPGLS